MDTYNEYKKHLLVCPYCQSQVNLWYILPHLKGKRCLKYQKLYFESNPEKKESDFLLYINEMKKQIKYESGESEIVN
jgi:hypothetical protein